MRLVDDWLKRSLLIGLVVGVLLLIAWFGWQLALGAQVFSGLSGTNLAISGLVALITFPIPVAAGLVVSLLAGCCARLLPSAPTWLVCGLVFAVIAGLAAGVFTRYANGVDFAIVLIAAASGFAVGSLAARVGLMERREASNRR